VLENTGSYDIIRRNRSIQMRKSIFTFIIVLAAAFPAFSDTDVDVDVDMDVPFGRGFVAGASLGTPGLLNITLGYVGNRIGFWGTTSMLYFITDDDDEEDTHAYHDDSDDDGNMFLVYQINGAYKLYKSENWSVYTSAVFGQYVFWEDDKMDTNLIYFGPAVELRYRHIFLEAGVGYSPSKVYDDSDKFSNHLVPIVQLGGCIGF
jgi:hypothetical protein